MRFYFLALLLVAFAMTPAGALGACASAMAPMEGMQALGYLKDMPDLDKSIRQCADENNLSGKIDPQAAMVFTAGTRMLVSMPMTTVAGRIVTMMMREPKSAGVLCMLDFHPLGTELMVTVRSGTGTALAGAVFKDGMCSKVFVYQVQGMESMASCLGMRMASVVCRSLMNIYISSASTTNACRLSGCMAMSMLPCLMPETRK